MNAVAASHDAPLGARRSSLHQEGTNARSEAGKVKGQQNGAHGDSRDSETAQARGQVGQDSEDCWMGEERDVGAKCAHDVRR